MVFSVEIDNLRSRISNLTDLLEDGDTTSIEPYKKTWTVLSNLLNESIQTGEEKRFDILIDSNMLSYLKEICLIILKSKIHKKMDIVRRILSVRGKITSGKALIQRIMKRMHPGLDDIDKIIILIDIAEELKGDESFSYLSEEIRLKLKQWYNFTVHHAWYTILFNYKSLNALLYYYTEVYENFLTNILNYAKAIPMLPEPESINLIFNHPSFKENGNCLNYVFEFVFHVNIFYSAANFTSCHQEKLINLFLVVLKNCHGSCTISQKHIDNAYSCIINHLISISNVLSFRNREGCQSSLYSFPITAPHHNELNHGRFIATLTYHGYSPNCLDMPDSFIKLMDKSTFVSHLFNTILVNCDQKNFHNFTIKAIGCPSIMSLKFMARFIIRKSLKKPFQANLEKLISIYKLPCSIQTIIDMQDDLEFKKF